MSLDRLIGTWDVQAIVDSRPVEGSATTTFEWIEDGAFPLERDAGGPGPGAPQEWIENSPFPVVSIIGRDDAGDELTMLYADAPGFDQRFAYWEMSKDGVAWTKDFDVVYTKRRAQGPA